MKPEVQRESPFDDCTTSDIKRHDTHMLLHCGLTGGVTWLNTVFFVGQVIIFTHSAECRKEHFVPSHWPVLQSRSLHLSPVWTGGVLTHAKGVWALSQKYQTLALKASPWQKVQILLHQNYKMWQIIWSQQRLNGLYSDTKTTWLSLSNTNAWLRFGTTNTVHH